MRGRRPRQPSAQPQGEGGQIFGVFEAWTAGASREFSQNSELFFARVDRLWCPLVIAPEAGDG